MKSKEDESMCTLTDVMMTVDCVFTYPFFLHRTKRHCRYGKELKNVKSFGMENGGMRNM